MEKWQLYSFLTKNNSEVCYEGFSWEDIPLDENKSHKGYSKNCDYGVGGKKTCSLSCGVIPNKTFELWNKKSSSDKKFLI